MSDQGRKDFSQQLKEEVKPDSEKGYMEKGKEYVSSTADRLQGKMQPEENKGLGQGIHDSYKEGKDEAHVENAGNDFKQEVNEYYNSAKEKLNEAAKYVSKSMHGDDTTSK